MRETLVLEMPISAAMCSWVQRSRRKFSTASAVASGIWFGGHDGLALHTAPQNGAVKPDDAAAVITQIDSENGDIHGSPPLVQIAPL
jgi:hypothetical protein